MYKTLLDCIVMRYITSIYMTVYDPKLTHNAVIANIQLTTRVIDEPICTKTCRDCARTPTACVCST